MLLLGFSRRGDAALRPFRRWYPLALLCASLLFALLFILSNTALSDVSFGTADRFLKFGASWGTDRGRIWRFCMEQFCNFPPWQQLLGGGPGCVYRLDAARNVFSDASIDSAHNEFLHYLLTVGVVGLAAYVGLLGCICISALRRRNEHPLLSALLLGVLCYAAQSFVNIAQPVATPYLFLFLALLRGLLSPTPCSVHTGEPLNKCGKQKQ